MVITQHHKCVSVYGQEGVRAYLAPSVALRLDSRPQQREAQQEARHGFPEHRHPSAPSLPLTTSVQRPAALCGPPVLPLGGGSRASVWDELARRHGVQRAEEVIDPPPGCLSKQRGREKMRGLKNRHRFGRAAAFRMSPHYFSDRGCPSVCPSVCGCGGRRQQAGPVTSDAPLGCVYPSHRNVDSPLLATTQADKTLFFFSLSPSVGCIPLIVFFQEA